MFTRQARFARSECEHETAVIVRNSGIERTVCEKCGHVSLRGLEGLSGQASRSQFERASERTHAPVG